MKKMVLIGLAMLACACGGGKEPEKFTPDQSTFESAVETYARALEDGNEAYAADIFPANEKTVQFVGLRNDIEAAKKKGTRYKILTATAEPINVEGVESAYVVRLTRVEVDESDAQVGESVSTWTVFIKDKDGKWRLSGEVSGQYRRQRAAEEAAAKRAAEGPPTTRPGGNAPAANTPAANTPAANTPAGNAPAEGG